MARKTGKIKLKKTAYITFACLLVALIVMIVLAIPTSHERITQKFMGSYESEESQNQQEPQMSYYAIDDEHVLSYISFGKLKRNIKKDKTMYVLFGDCNSVDFHLEAIKVNDVAVEKGIEKVYLLDSNTVDDEDLDYIRGYLRKVNENAKAVALMAKTDLWAFKSNEMINAASRSIYKPISLSKTAELHILIY